jgi:prevent-host-death family protein
MYTLPQRGVENFGPGVSDTTHDADRCPRGQLGRLVDDVAGGAQPVSLTNRGRPVAVLVSRDEWEALQQLVRAEARDGLLRRLTQVRARVA